VLPHCSDRNSTVARNRYRLLQGLISALRANAPSGQRTRRAASTRTACREHLVVSFFRGVGHPSAFGRPPSQRSRWASSGVAHDPQTRGEPFPAAPRPGDIAARGSQATPRRPRRCLRLRAPRRGAGDPMAALGDGRDVRAGAAGSRPRTACGRPSCRLAWSGPTLSNDVHTRASRAAPSAPPVLRRTPVASHLGRWRPLVRAGDVRC
jgi:hypothetical protein